MSDPVSVIWAVVLLAALAPVPYWIGSGRWHLSWMRTTYDIGIVLFVVFLPWYLALRVFDSPSVLIPVAMIAFTSAFAIGRWSLWRSRRERHQGSR